MMAEDPTEEIIRKEVAEAARILREDGISVRLSAIEAKFSKHFPDDPPNDPDTKDGDDPNGPPKSPDPKDPQTSLSQRKEDSGGEMLSEQNSLVSVPCWPNGIDISNHQPQFDWAAW